MAAWSILIGRFLLGLYFLLPGVMKFAAWEETLTYVQGHELSPAAPLLAFSGIVNIAGGILLMAGRHVRLVAYGFVAYILLVNFFLHDFWTMSGESAARETQNFVKNLGILAGLLALAGHSPARGLSLAGWWRSDKAVA